MNHVIMLVIGGSASVLYPLNGSADTGVFVFGSLLDFNRGVEAHFSQAPLRNCSTKDFYCIDGEAVNLVVPRVCGAMKVGQSWKLGAIETRVLGSITISNAHYPSVRYPAYYLHSNQRPEVVLLYSGRQGVMRIFYDVRGKSDFQAKAKAGSLDTYYLEAIRDPLKSYAVMNPVTLDTLAECTKPA